MIEEERLYGSDAEVIVYTDERDARREFREIRGRSSEASVHTPLDEHLPKRGEPWMAGESKSDLSASNRGERHQGRSFSALMG